MVPAGSNGANDMLAYRWRLLLPGCLALGLSQYAAVEIAASDAGSKEAPARIDRYGDPLPEGALLRLGTLRFRYPCFRESHRQLLADGKTLVISSGDELRWVDTETGRYVRRRPLRAGASVCGFSNDSRLALLMCRDVLRLWDVAAWKELRIFDSKGQELGPEIDALFASDGKLVVTNSGFNHELGLIRLGRRHR
jgi:hypothetical protein